MTTQDITGLGVHRMFSESKVSAVIGGNYYLIELNELLAMLEHLPLTATKARKYNYLTIDQEQMDKEGINADTGF